MIDYVADPSLFEGSENPAVLANVIANPEIRINGEKVDASKIDQVLLEPGTHEITSDTDFAMVAMRIRANQSDPDDGEAIAALRAGVKLEVGGDASHVRPNYDMEQLVALRDEFSIEGTKLGTLMGMQGAHGTIEPMMHLYGTAIG